MAHGMAVISIFSVWNIFSRLIVNCEIKIRLYNCNVIYRIRGNFRAKL